jgi:ribosomal protein L6P/L9E
MSRIGKMPVNLPAKVSVELLDGNVVKVKGWSTADCSLEDS